MHSQSKKALSVLSSLPSKFTQKLCMSQMLHYGHTESIATSYQLVPWPRGNLAIM